MVNNILSTDEIVNSLLQYNNPAAQSQIPAVNTILKDYNQANNLNNDNLMKSYYLQSQAAQAPAPAQSGGWWENVKNFAGSPWGRTALSSLGTGLAVGLSGGSPLEALSYGAQSGGKTMDILRRRQEQQEKRDLEKQYFDSKLAETQEQRDFQQDLLRQRSEQNKLQADQEFQRDLAKLTLQNEYNRQLQQEKQALGNQQLQAPLSGIETQLKSFEDTFPSVNQSKLRSYSEGALRDLTGNLTPEQTEFNAQRTLLFNKIARDLGGEKGVLSDQDINRVSKSLPTIYDSDEQKRAKMNAIYNLLNIRKQQVGGNMVAVRSPSGKIVNVPQDKVQEALANGGELI